jgi:hypothetical protein
MKKFFLTLLAALAFLGMAAQGTQEGKECYD